MKFNELKSIVNDYHTGFENVQLISAYTIDDYYVVRLKLICYDGSCIHKWYIITQDKMVHSRGSIGPDYCTLISKAKEVKEEIPIEPLQIWKNNTTGHRYLIMDVIGGKPHVVSLVDKSIFFAPESFFRNNNTYLDNATRTLRSISY